MGIGNAAFFWEETLDRSATLPYSRHARCGKVPSPPLSGNLGIRSKSVPRMMKKSILATSVCALFLAVGCGGATQTSTPPPVTTPTPVTIVINAPVPASPADGTSSTGWPTLVVNNSTHTGPAGALVYRFDISTTSDFFNIVASGSVAEGSGQTSYTPPNVTPPPADLTTFYWRAVAIDPLNQVTSAASTTVSFKFSNPPTKAQQIAQQEGAVLWPGAVPPGAPGSAVMGNGWQIGNVVSWNGERFLSPTVEELQVFDCLDRGMQPQQAIDWIHSHGYSTQAAWAPDVSVIAFHNQYMALISGRWDMVLRSGA